MTKSMFIASFFACTLIAICVLFLFNYYVLEQQLKLTKAIFVEVSQVVDSEEAYICTPMYPHVNEDYIAPTEA